MVYNLMLFNTKRIINSLLYHLNFVYIFFYNFYMLFIENICKLMIYFSLKKVRNISKLINAYYIVMWPSLVICIFMTIVMFSPIFLLSYYNLLDSLDILYVFGENNDGSVLSKNTKANNSRKSYFSFVNK